MVHEYKVRKLRGMRMVHEYKVHKPLRGTSSDVRPRRYPSEDVLLVEFMYLVFTCMPGESYHRRLRTLLLYLCYVFQALINSLVSSFCEAVHGDQVTALYLQSLLSNFYYFLIIIKYCKPDNRLFLPSYFNCSFLLFYPFGNKLNV